MGLFGKKEAKPTPPAKDHLQPPPTNDRTRIGSNLSVSGTITGSDHFEIQGKGEGTFDLKGRMEIGTSAEVKGEIKVNSLNVQGKIDGNINATAMVTLGVKARAQGTLTSPRLSVAEGAIFDGEIHMSRRGSQTHHKTT